MKARQIIEDPETGTQVIVTRQAATLIGPANVEEFAETVIMLLKALDADSAYVGRTGTSLTVTIFAADKIFDTWTIRRPA